MKAAMHIDPAACTGCTVCEMICSFEHEKVFNPLLSRITVLKEEEQGIDLPIVCMHCEDPICADVCLVGAIKKEGDGKVHLDSNACRGCQACIMACPYGAVRFVGGKTIKCDLCNGEPQCAKWCPTGAISLISSESMEITRRKKLVEIMMKNTAEAR